MNRLTEKNVEAGSLMYSTIYMHDAIVHRLGQYEDSGMTPAEVMEFARMKKQGRIKIAPCAEGDVVYEIRSCHVRGHKMYDYSVKGHKDRLTFFPQSCYVQSKKFTKSDQSYLGRTVFLTEEAALAKLEEAKKASGDRPLEV